MMLNIYSMFVLKSFNGDCSILFDNNNNRTCWESIVETVIWLLEKILIYFLPSIIIINVLWTKKK